MDMIRTVSGDIEIEKIGTTLCHEHLRIDLKKIFQEPEEKIDYEVDSSIRQEKVEKISIFTLLRKFLSKKIRSIFICWKRF